MFDINRIFTLFATQNSGGFYESIHKTTDRQCPAVCAGTGTSLLTGQVPQIGNMLLPMHFPVFLCAFLCGWQYALFLGFLLPICRSMIFGMPHMFPVAITGSLWTYCRADLWTFQTKIHSFSLHRHDFRHDSGTCGMGHCRSSVAWHW